MRSVITKTLDRGTRTLAGLILCVLLGAAPQAHEQPTNGQHVPSPWPGYSVRQTRDFHRAFQLKEWLKHGELSHYVWLSMAEFFPNGVVPRRGPVTELEKTPSKALRLHIFEVPEGKLTLDELLREREVIGLVVLHRGKVVYEEYVRMRESDRYLTHSVSKVLVGTLIALLEQRGILSSDRTVDTYLPGLKDTDWKGVRLRDVVDMAAGFDADGDLFDPETLDYQLEATLGSAPRTDKTPASPIDILASMKRTHQPGSQYRYQSACTQVAALVAEEAGGKPLHELLSQEIWSKIGAEADALWQMSKDGVPVGHAGFSCTLRDLARFGLLYTDSWNVVTEERILTKDSLRTIQAGGKRVLFQKNKRGSYQWDIIDVDGDLFKGGHGGQGLYVSASRDLVIAGFGMTKNLKAKGIYDLSRSIATSGVLGE